MQGDRGVAAAPASRQCHPGRRVGDIGAAVQDAAEGHGYSVVREFVGHGIGTSLHEEPQVPNYGPPGRRERLVPGMCLAIEPMVNVGGPEVRVLDDGWTAVTVDGSLSAHFELSVAVTPDGPWILSEPYPYGAEQEAEAERACLRGAGPRGPGGQRPRAGGLPNALFRVELESGAAAARSPPTCPGRRACCGSCPGRRWWSS